MTRYYRTDVLVLEEPAGPDDLRKINDLVVRQGFPPPLTVLGGGLPAGTVLRLSGVDAKVVTDLVYDSPERLTKVGLKHQFSAGTFPTDGGNWPPIDKSYGLAAPFRPDFSADGVKAGHAVLTWVEEQGTDLPAKPEWRRMPEGRRRPVVALLDTPVLNHAWLPQPGPAEDPFLLRPQVGWDTDGPWWTAAEVNGHRGHGTFIAGLIRMQSEDAQILSLPVMRDDGAVDEDTAIAALNWLYDYRGPDTPVDVVCMAFGRQTDVAHGDDGLRIAEPMRRLAAAGVKIVTSAGNDGSDVPVVPASVAPELGGLSVGAGVSEDHHATFSNHGSWVNSWNEGENVLSIEFVWPRLWEPDDPNFEHDGWARWSGTSFAAGRTAGQEAAKVQQPG